MVAIIGAVVAGVITVCVLGYLAVKTISAKLAPITGPITSAGNAISSLAPAMGGGPVSTQQSGGGGFNLGNLLNPLSKNNPLNPLSMFGIGL